MLIKRITIINKTKKTNLHKNPLKYIAKTYLKEARHDIFVKDRSGTPTVASSKNCFLFQPDL